MRKGNKLRTMLLNVITDVYKDPEAERHFGNLSFYSILLHETCQIIISIQTKHQKTTYAVDNKSDGLIKRES